MAKNNRTKMLMGEWRASSSLAGVYALRMLGMFLVLPVLALHAASMPGAQNKEAWIGLAMGIYGLTQAILQLPLGMASDRYGRKKVIYLGLIVFAGGSFMAAAATSLEMLVIARAIQGAGAVSAAVTALLADLTRDEVRTRAMAMIGLSIGLTFSVSLVLSPLLAKWIGVPGLFTLTGVLTILSMLVVAFFTPNPTRSKVHEDAQAQPARMGEVLGNSELLRLNFGIFALHAAQMALFVTLPFAMVAQGLAKDQHWQVYLPATVIGLVLMIPLIIVGETRNKLKQVFVGGIACIAAAQLGLLFGLDSLAIITVCLVIYFIGFNVLEASLPSMVSKIAPSELKGTAMGLYNTAQSIGLFTGGVVGGVLFQYYGFEGVFTFCSILILVWLLIALLAPAPKAVKNVTLAVGAVWRGRESQLLLSLEQVAGIEQTSLSRDQETIYIKALQHGFDEDATKKIISGVENVIE